MKYIDADRLCAEIEKIYKSEIQPWLSGVSAASAIYDYVLPLIASLQQEQPEVDLEKLKNKAELIANEIMMGVQANKYHTCIYDKASNDFNHSHLVRAALKGIEFGLNAKKEETK